ncbi:hypothetical protein GCM10011348_33010 [Marinobacterium nitratireducens]|uniref:Uncharacterized protein n=1 Tax=Marinobacterium nitratireducens TaxID=518897 RepID=A0A918DW69_9GAMM|nr:hypothetical protein GCM10011348_33010 [Marinobacterium nitratireducens]
MMRAVGKVVDDHQAAAMFFEPKLPSAIESIVVNDQPIDFQVIKYRGTLLCVFLLRGSKPVAMNWPYNIPF